MTNKINSIKLLTLLLLSTIICAELFASEVNVYSGRKEKLIKPLLDEFSKETGVKVNLVTAKSSALLKRLELEAQSSPADIFITVDVGRLHHAKKIGLFQKIDKESLVNVKEAYLDKDGYFLRTWWRKKKFAHYEIKDFDTREYAGRKLIVVRLKENFVEKIGQGEEIIPFPCTFGRPVEEVLAKLKNNLDKSPKPLNEN